jgi:hypothetical protein
MDVMIMPMRSMVMREKGAPPGWLLPLMANGVASAVIMRCPMVMRGVVMMMGVVAHRSSFRGRIRLGLQPARDKGAQPERPRRRAGFVS